MKKNKRDITWNGKDEIGQEFPSGLYFYRLEAGNYKEIKEMILFK